MPILMLSWDNTYVRAGLLIVGILVAPLAALMARHFQLRPPMTGVGLLIIILSNGVLLFILG